MADYSDPYRDEPRQPESTKPAGIRQIEESIAKISPRHANMDRDGSPAQAEFGRLSRAISELDATIVELREKVASALGPDYPREDETEKALAIDRQSDLVEALRENTLRVRSLRDVVESINRRLEL